MLLCLEPRFTIQAFLWAIYSIVGSDLVMLIYPVRWLFIDQHAKHFLYVFLVFHCGSCVKIYICTPKERFNKTILVWIIFLAQFVQFHLVFFSWRISAAFSWLSQSSIRPTVGTIWTEECKILPQAVQINSSIFTVMTGHRPPYVQPLKCKSYLF